MKNLQLCLAVMAALSSTQLHSQTPNAINFQAVARDGAGNVMASQTINLSFLIYDASSAGNIQYQEDQTSITTNQFGLFSVKIGEGVPITGTFDAIDWAGSEAWLEVKVNGASLGSRSRLVAVPYALLARDVENDAVDDADADSTNELQTLSKSASTITLSHGGGTVSSDDADADPANELQTLSKVGSTVTLSMGGGSFTDDVNDADASPINELQTLSISGSQLSISSGNTVTLPTATLSGAGTTNYLPKFTSANVIANSRLYDNGTNVGIGTTIPAAPLHIVNPTSSSEALRIQGSGSWLAFWDGIFYDGFLWNNVGNIGLGTSNTNSAGNLVLYTYGSERMRITSGGFIGMGISSPSYKLHVETTGVAIHGRSTSNYGLYGYSSGQLGVYGYSNAASSAGIFGQSAYIGVEGITNASSTDGSRQGVRGDNHGSATGWAGYFFGRVGVSGTLSKGGGSFKIDHPLDPENKFLYHSFVESPDMKNIYDGVVTTDTSGEATVEMPIWFDSLNRDFRYQLTVIGSFARAMVAEEMANNTFTIKTDAPNTKVSWQVTGIRKDAFANYERIPIEVEKKDYEKGKYLHPEAFGKPNSMALDYRPANQPTGPPDAEN